jgi:hypothetical protein
MPGMPKSGSGNTSTMGCGGLLLASWND